MFRTREQALAEYKAVSVITETEIDDFLLWLELDSDLDSDEFKKVKLCADEYLKRDEMEKVKNAEMDLLQRWVKSCI